MYPSYLSTPPSNINGSHPQHWAKVTRPLPRTNASPMAPMYDQDLYALRRRDPLIVSTFARFSHVTCYRDEEQRGKQDFEGRMLLYEREIYPAYGFCIMNDLGTIDHIQHLYPEDDISFHGNRLKLQSYPDFTSRRLSLAQSSSTEVVDKFSDVYAILNLECLENRKGTPKTVELAPTDDMFGVFMRLHSCIKDNKPYSCEVTSGPTSTSNATSTPSSPVSPLFQSPSTSESLFSSPATSPSPPFPPSLNPTPPLQCSPSAMPNLLPGSQFLYHHTDSDHENSSSTYKPTSLRPVQGNNDYHRRAVLNRFTASSSVPASPRSSPRSTLIKAATEWPSLGTSAAKLPQSHNFLAYSPHSTTNGSQRLPSSEYSTHSAGGNVASQVVASTNHSTFPVADEDAICPPDLTGKVSETDKYSFARGRFSDIYKGQLRTSRDAKICVAIKIIRIPGFKDDDADVVRTVNNRLDRESKNWTTLSHPNVLPFLGICRDFGPFPALISPYCPYRDVVYYLKHNPTVNRWRIVTDVTNGLLHLHRHGVVHGDLKGTNILIDESGEPCISDFGVSKIIDCQSFTTGFVGTPSFMAPELFPDDDEEIIDNHIENLSFRPMVTKETDVYAYSLVVLQILTGKDPIRRSAKRKTQAWPKRHWYDPDSITSERLWGLFESCCDFDPRKRPTMEEVMERIRSMVVASNH